MPPEPGLNGNTLRQVVHVSLGGDRLRVRLSNEFGTEPVSITAAQIAASDGGSAIKPDTDQALEFDGESAITIPPGEAVLSDPFSFNLEPLSNVALTLHISKISSDVTGHPGSRTTSYIQTGNHVSAPEMPDAAQTEHWYIIDAIDVMAPDSAAAVATLGNSITDGRGSGTNQQNRWPDELARRLQNNPHTQHVAVLNQGIGGNCVLRDCLGPAGLSRFQRDVLNQTGVSWLIILEGINDIGQAKGAKAAEQVAQDLINAYQKMINQAHSQNIKVYGATLMPFGGSFYDGPEREQARQKVNEWIRNSGAFDAVIDLDKALRDPDNPSQLLPAADTGDHLHPNETGHRLIAEAVDLSLFIIEKENS
ncbi:SGNH/GDSL hydrolase family protein [Aliifodinibius sp. S!AR15-10]|uniref:SGNH/GDSL hydrolase family protein n=1 Tax=Aliifodinibius sp. S!AR15-10 TaxID=2950437 RepID=UPI0028709B2F|nr:SGNH/GDSL hydrolase family protein [Aliifodinibius sp. S!AR15-10]